MLATGITGLVALALGSWKVAAQHRLDLTAALVVLILIGLPLLTSGRAR